MTDTDVDNIIRELLLIRRVLENIHKQGEEEHKEYSAMLQKEIRVRQRFWPDKGPAKRSPRAKREPIYKDRGAA
jgi:hypothetical protein